MNVWQRFLAVNGPIVLVGVLVIYLLGRWDGAEGVRLAGWLAETERHVENGLEWLRYRVERDSLKAEQDKAVARADSLGPQLNALGVTISELEHQISATAAPVSFAEKLPLLRLHAINSVTFETDSSGVEFLDSLRVAALQAPLVPLLREQVRTIATQRDELQHAVTLANERADSSDARVLVLEGLLEEGREIADCHIDPLGLIPCPSRGVAFLVGVGVGVGVVLVAGG